MAKIDKVQEVSLKKLKPYERNAKIHSKEQVAKIADSIEEFGFLAPVLIDDDYNIVAGHGRVMAAQKLGLEKVPCVLINDLDETHRKAYILADNRLGELAEWDMDLVNIELAELQDMDFDVTLTGFELPEIEDEPQEVVEDDFSEDVETRCKLGDIWQLGNHRLICGDCTDTEIISKLLEGEICEIAFTSPPYNVGNNAKLNATASMQDSKYLDSDDDLDDYDELLHDSTVNMITNSRWSFINLQMLANNKKIICEYLNEFKGQLCDVAIWNKVAAAPAMAERVMNSQFEFIFIFSNENNSRAIGTKYFRGTVPNIFQCPSQKHNEYSNIHSATFPIDFASHFILNFTNENESVLEPFAGTGTTMIACEQLNRKCYMAELDPHYCDVIITRWETFTGREAVLLNE